MTGGVKDFFRIPAFLPPRKMQYGRFVCPPRSADVLTLPSSRLHKICNSADEFLFVVHFRLKNRSPNAVEWKKKLYLTLTIDVGRREVKKSEQVDFLWYTCRTKPTFLQFCMAGECVS